MQAFNLKVHPWLALAAVLLTCTLPGRTAHASDHLDTPTVIADPAADIADLFAWTSTDGRRLNLVMTIVGNRFSDRLLYAFHVDSGKHLEDTTSSKTIVCQFDGSGVASCWADDADFAHGDASHASGLEGVNHRFRIFAGVRDDPFFNNVKGTRAALNLASEALQRGASVDAAGCPHFDAKTLHALSEVWTHTAGGPAANFLTGWKVGAVVVSVDLDVVNAGGPLLAIWAETYKAAANGGSARRGAGKVPPRPTLGAPIDRIGRPLTGNALIGPIAAEQESDRRKEAYNRAPPEQWQTFAPDIQQTLALYDGFDGECGNQWLADRHAEPRSRYHDLSKLLADDRLWVNSRSSRCTRYLAVELAQLAEPGSEVDDCGGRTPLYSASNVFRSLLVLGRSTGFGDGLKGDERVHSVSDFPFLAAP